MIDAPFISGRQINLAGQELIESFEGLSLTSYRDGAGVLTIGRGHTGPDVTAGMTITADRAEQLFEQDLQRAEAAVNAFVKVALNDNQFSALVSFAFNVGVGKFRGSTLLGLLNRGWYSAVPPQLARWDKITVAGTLQFSPGLARRRAAEAALWSRPIPLAASTSV